MKFQSIHIKEGIYERRVDFSDCVNLIYSERNSCGKTTLLRLLLYGIGYSIPGTKKLNFKKCDIKTVIETEKKGVITLLRNDKSSIIVEVGNERSTYVLPEQQNRVHELIFNTSHKDLLNNILGTFYVDQEKGWTLLNRGVVIGENRFSIEELIRGLSDVDCSELINKEARLSREIDKYKQMSSVALYQESLDKESLIKLSYQENVDIEMNKLLVKETEVKSELKRIDRTLSDNKKFKEFITDMKLLVMIPNGEPIQVTEKNIVGYEDSINLLIAKRKNATKRLANVTKQIEALKQENEQENEQISFFEQVNSLSTFDREIAKLSLNQVAINKEINKLKNERTAIRKQISEISTSNSAIIKSMQEDVEKYLEELQVEEKHSIPAQYIFTSDLKGLSGAVLHKTAFAFRLAYIIAVEKVLGIKLPVILDSPRGKEVDDENVEKMMNILKRDFSDHQIIIASIFEYSFDNVNKIVIRERLMEDMISNN